MPVDHLLTTAQTAEIAGLHQATIRRLCASGLLPARRVGRAWVIRRQDIARLETRPRVGRPQKERSR